MSRHVAGYSRARRVMSRTRPSGLSAWDRTRAGSAPGFGSPATSGGLPPWTRVCRTALRSRVPWNSTRAPVRSSKGFTMALKLSSSAPPQVPRTLTVPPILPAANESPAPPAASSIAAATTNTTAVRRCIATRHHLRPGLLRARTYLYPLRASAMMARQMAVAATRPRRGDEITLTIDRLAYGGRGVGRLDGFVVFVPDTAPGDRVRARLWRVKAGFGEADLLGIESPSPVRTAAPCPHFGPCSGCIWQHVTYDAQAAAKEAIVRESLAHLGGLRDVEVRPIVRMAAPWYYRNKMEFSFHPDGLGLHRRGAFDKIVPIETCYLESPRANIVLSEVDAFARTSGLSSYDPRSRTGMLRQVVIREAKGTGEVMVALVTTAREVPGLRGLADRLLAVVPEIASVAHGVNAGPSDGVPLTGVTIVAGQPYIREVLSGLTFRIGLETFFQTNTAQAEHLVGVVRADADLRGDETVFDLYCGVGTFSLALARRAARVYGIEIVAPAIDAARDNAVLNRIANV